MSDETTTSRIFLSTSAAEEACRQVKQMKQLGENIDALAASIISLAKLLCPSLARTSSPPETSTPVVIVQSVEQEAADCPREEADNQQGPSVSEQQVPPETEIGLPEEETEYAPPASSLPEELVIEAALPLSSSSLSPNMSLIDVEPSTFHCQRTVVKASTLLQTLNDKSQEMTS